MNTVETSLIFAVLEAVYPDFANRLSDEEYKGLIGLWEELFDEPYEVVSSAVKAFISTDEKGFSPKPGQIKALIRKMYGKEEMSEVEAVNIILKATRNSLYNSVEEFNKLPPRLQQLVGSPMQLREWAVSDSQTINSVIASNLQRSYRTISERQAELNALPESIKQHMRLAATSNMYLLD